MATSEKVFSDEAIAQEREKLTLYKAQLDAINEMLHHDNTADDLVLARNDLSELVKLCEESILAAEKAKLLAQVDTMVTSDYPETTSSDQYAVKGDQAPADNFSDFIGSLCHAVMRSHNSGRLIRHAVMILSIENDNTEEDEIKARILFIHPTELWMVPCEYFLQQRCTYLEKCRFSHGYLIKMKSILEYEEPDRSKLTSGSVCLALRKGSTVEGKRPEPNLWREAEIVSVSAETIVVQFPGNTFDAPVIVDSLPPDEVIPLCSDDNDIEEDMELLEEWLKPPAEAPKQASETEHYQPSASWEMHTKGIGSKLLAKMGWLGPGTGIGKSDQGRSEPIPVEVMPKGMSLDTFLQLRNEAGMVTLGKGAVKMLKSKAAHALIQKERQQQAINEQQISNKLSADEQFFSFLNESVKSTPQSSIDDPSPSKKMKKEPINDMSDKEIGITLIQTGEKIRKKELEISKMNESLIRLQRGRTVGQKLSESSDVERLKRKIAEANAELVSLKSQEKRAINQRSTERDRRKLTIF